MNENEIKDEQSSGLSQHENVDQKNKKDKKNSKWNSFKDLVSLKSKSKLYSFLVAVYTMVIILLGLASTMLIPIVDDKKTGITLMTSMAVPLSALLFVLSNIISEKSSICFNCRLFNGNVCYILIIPRVNYLKRYTSKQLLTR